MIQTQSLLVLSRHLATSLPCTSKQPSEPKSQIQENGGLAGTKEGICAEEAPDLQNEGQQSRTYDKCLSPSSLRGHSSQWTHNLSLSLHATLMHIHTLHTLTKSYELHTLYYMAFLLTLQTCIQTCTHTCMHACIHTYIHASIRACMHPSIHRRCMHAYIHLSIHPSMHVHTYIRTHYLRTYVRTHIRTYVHIRMHVHVHIHIHLHIHLPIHIHIDIPILIQLHVLTYKQKTNTICLHIRRPRRIGTHVHAHTCACTYTCTGIHTHVRRDYMYTQTHICIYIHRYIHIPNVYMYTYTAALSTSYVGISDVGPPDDFAGAARAQLRASPAKFGGTPSGPQNPTT